MARGQPLRVVRHDPTNGDLLKSSDADVIAVHVRRIRVFAPASTRPSSSSNPRRRIRNGVDIVDEVQRGALFHPFLSPILPNFLSPTAPTVAETTAMPNRVQKLSRNPAICPSEP